MTLHCRAADVIVMKHKYSDARRSALQCRVAIASPLGVLVTQLDFGMIVQPKPV